MLIAKRLVGAFRLGGLALAATFIAFSLSTGAFASSVNASGQAGAQAGAGINQQFNSGPGGYESRYGNNVPAVAPSLMLGNSTCLGGVAGAANAFGAGASVGWTHPDHDCRARAWVATAWDAIITASKLGLPNVGGVSIPNMERWTVNVMCASAAMGKHAPPGACSPAKSGVAANVSPAPPVKTVARITPAKPSMVLAKVRVSAAEAKGALAYCAFPSLVWSAYPACYHTENVLASSLSSDRAVPAS